MNSSEEPAIDIREALKLTAQWYGLTKSARIDAWGANSWRLLQQEFVAHASISPGSFVLDVGTGTGGTAIEAARKVGPVGYVVGIDNAPNLVKIAHNEAHDNGLTNVAFAATDMGRLGFIDETFEHIISNFAIYGSFPPGVGLQEAFRVLKKGGHITFSMFGNWVNGGQLWRIVETIWRRYWPTEPHSFSARVKEAFKVAPYGFLPYGPLTEPADPSKVLGFIAKLGFKDIRAVISYKSKALPSVEHLIAWFAADNLEPSEMDSELMASFKKECTAAVQPFFLDRELSAEIEVMYFSGRK